MLTYWKNGQAPSAPFFAVIFVSKKTDELEGYAAMDDLLMNEAQKQMGFLGYSSVSNSEGGIFISYWASREAIDIWRKHTDHQVAKQKAPRQWYQYYLSIISEVSSVREFHKNIQAMAE
ncbi:MAG TPA: antibiotic biosynthesis monooxygenase [Cryomorphaceae bacterium]|nr:antibiotic biosynthesis monooxygenase [Owenweeksia sp.]MBF97630.1 antibiotic biosynthesis monooxygenase [Owenweeksia sp.]HAD98150.1 antibiotic biosynthesis monooxygenase [Cryomorphaceae bacterium]HBF20605.1 antibiotic biosynthesis monooxygenase [Cryomorphaceae bacterium]HCQ16631.1 antibiotic biosynthesis monooxygenase [Cryomorphaceae bacterium]|tara:strand:+ start:1343 stop:1699 length:357 start_codon:yes stop_codon:yes gene_type:complete